MEIGIDWPIGRSHMDLHHWKHSSSRKATIGWIKDVNVPSNLFMWSSGNALWQKKNERKKTTWAAFETSWMKYNVHASEHSSKRILHFRIFHVTFLPQWKRFRSILFKRLPQNGADLTDGLLNNVLFVCMTVPLKCLIQPQTGVTGTYVSLPACTLCMSVLNPLNRTDWPALFPGISKITLYKLKCLMKDCVPYENAKISSSSYISAITHANGLLPSPDHSARKAGLQIMRVCGYKTSNICKKQERGEKNGTRCH